MTVARAKWVSQPNNYLIKFMIQVRSGRNQWQSAVAAENNSFRMSYTNMKETGVSEERLRKEFTKH